MSETSRATVYFDEQLHRALKIKSATTNLTISELVNRAVRVSLAEDQEDLAAATSRIAEPTVSYEAFLNQLKRDGAL